MIKVIVGHKLKAGADIQPTLMKLRSHAMTYPGFISAENMMNSEDNSIVFVMYTWNKIGDWHLWENTITRGKILKEANSLMCEPPRVSVYHILPTTGGLS